LVKKVALARLVPPLNPLHVFEVAARAGSFTRAAEILTVSPSAVSRQIAALESFLDVRLFHRAREGNVLTEVGEKYYRAIAPAFEAITSATDKVTRARDSAPLNVRVPATFAVHFLIPRLSVFKEEHPNTNVRIITGFGPVDFVREDVDISIQVGSGDWPGTESKMLFANWVQPMCNPKLFKHGKPIKSIDDLRGYRLLISKNRRNDWRDWLECMGHSYFPLEEMETFEFPNSMLAYQAAADGLGIVLGQIPMLGPKLAGQPLIRLFDKPIREGSYYAVWRAETGPSRKVRQFVSWLQRQLEPILARLPKDIAPGCAVRAAARG
jgi:LysR family transcriptional regulator, glycine cleavage system transcriptional activator